MTVTHLKEAHNARPFRPFVLRLADGQAVPVRHPEMMLITPGGKTAFVAVDEERVKIIDLMLVVSVDWSNGSVKSTRESSSE